MEECIAVIIFIKVKSLINKYKGKAILIADVVIRFI